jgi:hypothetical protein
VPSGVAKLPGDLDDAQAVRKEWRHFLGQEVLESLFAHDGVTTEAAAEIKLDLRPGLERRSAPDRSGCFASFYIE